MESLEHQLSFDTKFHVNIIMEKKKRKSIFILHRVHVPKDLAGKNLNFWPKSMRPLQSPDLNPLDYSIWSVVQGKAQATSHRNKEELKASIIKVWDEMDQSYIVKCCKGF